MHTQPRFGTGLHGDITVDGAPQPADERISRGESLWRLFTWIWRLIFIGVVLSAISTPSRSSAVSATAVSGPTSVQPPSSRNQHLHDPR